ncbi:DUF948 domain-containing protein [Glycomyces sp. NEAU-7082]|uniref:DUF948 domain-containing protein n=1 Tax=Glycomyces albidus TaxID=2656774 RepID=A0A6L5GB39_9ACTN|nr:DUF948 domain-containing protein [Glycomyces albidus]
MGRGERRRRDLREPLVRGGVPGADAHLGVRGHGRGHLGGVLEGGAGRGLDPGRPGPVRRRRRRGGLLRARRALPRTVGGPGRVRGPVRAVRRRRGHRGGRRPGGPAEARRGPGDARRSGLVPGAPRCVGCPIPQGKVGAASLSCEYRDESSAVPVGQYFSEGGRAVPGETLAVEFTNVGLWEVALLIVAVAIFIVSLILAVGLLRKLTGTVNRVNRVLDKVDHEIGPILRNANATLDNVNASLVQVEGELEKVGSITTNAAHVSSNVANITSLVVSAVGSPLVKAAAFGFGLRTAVKKRNQGYDEDQVRRMVEASRQNKREAKRAAKASRKRAAK